MLLFSPLLQAGVQVRLSYFRGLQDLSVVEEREEGAADAAVISDKETHCQVNSGLHCSRVFGRIGIH